ncbi:MAG: flagellar hook-length control protein FliK, partial [Spirochaetaceae bacterium]|nr:flagellar hook-length control protein FliK [Spirochaetaceae bacterium]
EKTEKATSDVAKLPKKEEVAEKTGDEEKVEPAVLEEPAFVDLEKLREELGIKDAAKNFENLELDTPQAKLPENLDDEKLAELIEKSHLHEKKNRGKFGLSSEEDQKTAMNGEIDRLLHMAEKNGENKFSEITKDREIAENLKSVTHEDDKSLLEKDGKLIAQNEELPQIPVKTLEEKIFVQDMRTVNSDEAKKVLVGAKDEKETFTKEISVEPDGTAKMVLTLNEDAKPASNIAPRDTVGSTQKTFGQMLTAEIKQSADAFVKAGMISLKDGNSGSINLVLRPETLGDVKISLDLSDNLLTGKIVVATQEAYNAFKENLDVLKQGFNAQGFDAQNFDLSWSGAQTANGESNGEKPGNAAFVTKNFSRNMIFDDDGFSGNGGYSSYSSSKVNIIA